MIGSDRVFTQLEACNRDGKMFFIGVLKRTDQFSPEELTEMETLAQKTVDEFGIKRRSCSSDWKAVFRCMYRHPEKPFGCMDNAERFVGYGGNPIVISQPYIPDIEKVIPGTFDKKLKEFADLHGMEYVRMDELSYHHPGKTTLIVWRRKRKETVNQTADIKAQEAE